MSKSKHIVIPIFIPHKGCPFDCIYCNQKVISGQMEEMSEEKMRTIVVEHLSTISKDSYVEIGFYGGSFTGLEKEIQIIYLKAANDYISNNKVKKIRLSTRPDYINEQILEYLKLYNVAAIELGVQSLDEEVLRQSCRGHSVDDVIMSSRLIKEYDINLGIQTMIGLPGDNKEKDLYTARRVSELMPQFVRIYPTLVIKGTYLEKLYNEGIYRSLNLDEAVDICAELLETYENRNIKVIRMGLQSTDRINEDNDVVAGPFHPAFRQLVESRHIRGKIEELILRDNLENEEAILIFTKKGFYSTVVGNKKENLKYLQEKFKYKIITVEEIEDIKEKIRVLRQ